MLSIIPLVSAVPPVQTTTSDSGLSIAYPQYQYLPFKQNFTLYVHVYNSSQYIKGAIGNCYLDLYSSSGEEIMSNIMTAGGGSDYFVFVNKNNFTNYGLYSYIIQCNTTSQAGFANGVFQVSGSGQEMTTGRALLDFTFIITLIFSAGLFIVLAKITESPGIKLFFNLLAYLLIFLAIGSMYIVLQDVNSSILSMSNSAMYIMGIVFVITMFYVLINLTKHSLALMRAKKGFGSELDDSPTF